MGMTEFSDYCEYDGDWIEAKAWAFHGQSFDDFLLELDRALDRARMDAVDCFINLHEQDFE